MELKRIIELVSKFTGGAEKLTLEKTADTIQRIVRIDTQDQTYEFTKSDLITAIEGELIDVCCHSWVTNEGLLLSSGEFRQFIEGDFFVMVDLLERSENHNQTLLDIGFKDNGEHLSVAKAGSKLIIQKSEIETESLEGSVDVDGETVELDQDTHAIIGNKFEYLGNIKVHLIGNKFYLYCFGGAEVEPISHIRKHKRGETLILGDVDRDIEEINIPPNTVFIPASEIVRYIDNSANGNSLNHLNDDSDSELTADKALYLLGEVIRIATQGKQIKTKEQIKDLIFDDRGGDDVVVAGLSRSNIGRYFAKASKLIKDDISIKRQGKK